MKTLEQAILERKKAIKEIEKGNLAVALAYLKKRHEQKSKRV
jgi:hypothetical protein